MFAAAAQVLVALTSGNKGRPLSAALLDGRAGDLLTKPDFTLCAFLYLAAMGCSNEALRYVSYPFQALAKSCKMIPVMLSRVVLLRVRYGWQKYACVVAMTAGVAMFQLTRVRSGKADGPSTELYGVLLLGGSLALDGLTGPTQERTHKKYPCSNLSFMLLNNLHAGVVVGVPLVLSNQLIDGVQFCFAHPDVLHQLMMFALLSAMGQLFIFYTLLSFDSLVCVTVTTTRKFLTIVLSVWLHGNRLSGYQWLATLLVFTAIVLDAIVLRRPKSTAGVPLRKCSDVETGSDENDAVGSSSSVSPASDTSADGQNSLAALSSTVAGLLTKQDSHKA